MAISKGSSAGREARCFTLAVEHYDAQDMECIVYEGEQEQGACCRSYMELAWQMEQGFKAMDYPTPSVKKREFSACVPAKAGVGKPAGKVVFGRREGSLGTFRIRVSQCLHATWQGQISRDENGQDMALFENFLDFLLILDEMLTGRRTIFTADESSMTDSLAAALLFAGRYDGIWVDGQDSDEILIGKRRLEDGEKETFAIRPLFRENHTFQGSISWMEGRQQKNFRSVLELLFLIMSATGRRPQKEEG